LEENWETSSVKILKRRKKMDEKFKEWALENNALDGEKPKKLLKRLRAENKWIELSRVTCPPDRTPDEWDIEIAEFLRL
jgi:hypothetical protein